MRSCMRKRVLSIYTYFGGTKFFFMQYTPGHVKETANYLQNIITTMPRVGIVLGTGLHHLVQHLHITHTLPYNSVPHFVASTVSFHKGQLLFGTISGVPVVAMQGRFHYYEGYSMQQITFPIRVMKELGIEYLLLSNAAGGINPQFKKGDLIITDDHLNFLPDNPLRGLGDEWGNRFVDMSRPYDLQLQNLLAEAFKTQNIAVKKGVYAAVMGPNLESRAEYRWLRNSGADAVGMSTVPEVIVAAHVGLPCASVSVITDECDPDNLQPVNIAEIIEVAGKADEKLSAVFKEVVGKLM